MARTLRTAKELHDISEHLFYELAMLINTAQILATGALGDSTLNNAVLESLAIHTRVLMDFLYLDDPRNDDVVAQDFMSASTSWAAIRPALTASLTLARQRAGKETAHLTYARLAVTSQDKHWPFVTLANDIKAAFDVFVPRVPEGNLHACWRS